MIRKLYYKIPRLTYRTYHLAFPQFGIAYYNFLTPHYLMINFGYTRYVIGIKGRINFL